MKLEKITINRKHEMFWNLLAQPLIKNDININRKHEMFWNTLPVADIIFSCVLTVNMKCFEIRQYYFLIIQMKLLTVNMKCFEIYIF